MNTHKLNMATRKKLPNLKICVDNTESSDGSDVEVQGSDSSCSSEDESLEIAGLRTRIGLEDGEVGDDDDNDILSIGSTQPTERRFLSGTSLRPIKPAYGEASEKREKRSQRFGTLSTPKQPITDIDIKNLYKSLGINTETLDQDPRGWRMEAILLRGTENMSTEDVFGYFSEYAPKGIEWIDDFSCNVLWLDKLTPARALLKLSSSCEDKLRQDQQTGDSETHTTNTLTQEVKDGSGTGKKTDAIVSAQTAAADDDDDAKVTVATEKKLGQRDSDNSADQREPVLNVLEEETMELDYDDNLDLTSDDPIDQALSTWENFTQNKKQRAERASETAHRKQGQGQIERRNELPAKEKQKILDEDSLASEDRKTRAQKGENQMISKALSDQMEVEKDCRQGDARSAERQDPKKEFAGREKTTKLKSAEKDKFKLPVKKEKMELDSNGSSSSSSSSGDDSSTASQSESRSESNSSGSSSSSSSSGNSSEGSKIKKKKTRSERDKEREAKRIIKKATAPPVIPPCREMSEIPWPPGWWRLGVPHSKTQYLFMRYAMKADKKLPGAEKRSQYYVKFGNPNFGGIKGFISNSRKRKLQTMDGEKELDVERQTLGPLTGLQSRLAGRLGTRRGGYKRRKEAAEGENERPRMTEGKDLRAVLNRDFSSYTSDSGPSPSNAIDSDDEMDYGAELERLMGDGPPMKKRFMRMHADDEEEKIQARRLAIANRESGTWQKKDQNYEEEEEEEEDVEERFPQRRGWVDYDNVEDDDPFNLFGTSKKETWPANRKLKSENDNIDDGTDYRHRFHREDNFEGGRERNVQHRLGGAGNGLDLRAKLQNLKRVKNRHY